MPKYGDMGRVPPRRGTRFEQIPRAEISRSTFDRSHGHKTTFNAGLLIPIYVDEALPGDTFNMTATVFARLATPIVPVMDNVYLETFFFAVPYRLVWDNWQKFNGEQENPEDSTDFLIPRLGIGLETGFETLADYFGIPPALDSENEAVSALPFRAYRLIWNEWFRDQNLQDSVQVPKGDGPDDPFALEYRLLRRGKRHDYFTSSLPWPQKGPSVLLPLQGDAPVKGIITDSQTYGTAGQVGSWFESGSEDPVNQQFSQVLQGSGSATILMRGTAGTGGFPDIVADLSLASGATINELRQAFQIQKLFERDARGGTRYTEILKAHFGVTSPDQRLQRPEYLGGGRTMVTVSPIAQTSSTDATSPQAHLAAVGIASGSRHAFIKSFTEHCILIGLAVVRADLNYQQGLDRMWSRRTRFDFFWPALQQIGEQAVLNKEIFVGDDAADQEVWGYQERYAEYRYAQNRISGRMRSGLGSLDIWHLAQDFATRPALNETFIQENPPIDRISAVPSEPHFLLDTWFRLRCARPMPTYGVPGLIDHF